MLNWGITSHERVSFGATLLRFLVENQFSSTAVSSTKKDFQCCSV